MSAESRKPEPVIVLHRDISTSNQISALLAVGGAMMEFLSEKPKDAENIPGARPLPGESRLAAETTLIKACSQLDSILEDQRRWGIDYQLELERLYIQNAKLSRQLAEQQARTLRAEQEKAEEQKRAAQEIQSPHFRYRPALLALTNGNWAAFLGDQKDLDNGIVGVGPNPAEALKNFDMMFSGVLPEHMRKLAEQREKELNENNSLDQTRTETPDNVGGAGDSAQAGSGDPGPQL